MRTALELPDPLFARLKFRAVQQPGVSYAQPAREGWDVFHGLIRRAELSPRLCTAAHLAALAITNQWRLVSFDHAFQAFSRLNLLQLR